MVQVPPVIVACAPNSYVLLRKKGSRGWDIFGLKSRFEWVPATAPSRPFDILSSIHQVDLAIEHCFLSHDAPFQVIVFLATCHVKHSVFPCKWIRSIWFSDFSFSLEFFPFSLQNFSMFWKFAAFNQGVVVLPFLKLSFWNSSRSQAHTALNFSLWISRMKRQR